MSDLPIFDIHCHPSLKIYLCNHDISEMHYPAADVLPTGMHVDLPGMKQADVRVILSDHYVPEAGFGHLPGSERLFKLLKLIHFPITDKFEPDTGSEGAFQRALASMALLTHQIEKANVEFNVVIPKSLPSFEEAYRGNSRIVLHCLEGAHHLGKNLSDDEYIGNLKTFREMGLCMLTLSHFFQNGICDSAGGIPPSVAKELGYSKPASTGRGLTSAGRKVVEWCQDNGVIIDLVHSTVETRQQVYDILEKRKGSKKVRPIVFSHSGVRELVVGKMANPDDCLILPDKAEIKQIAEFGGAIGIILMNYWLCGVEEDNPFKKDDGIPFVIQTIRTIKEVCNSFDNICIGTDLDGFTQVPDDVTHVRLLGRVRDAISSEFGPEATAKLCYGNALRIIRDGWS